MLLLTLFYVTAISSINTFNMDFHSSRIAKSIFGAATILMFLYIITAIMVMMVHHYNFHKITCRMIQHKKMDMVTSFEDFDRDSREDLPTVSSPLLKTGAHNYN